MTPDSSAAPQHVARRFLGRISAGAWDELADLYAEDAVSLAPMNLPRPRRIAGREALRTQFAAAAGAGYRFTVENLVLHGTEDPEVVVAEFDYTGTGPDGAPFRAANLQVFRVRDGLIVETRDYHDQLRLAAAHGHLPALLAALDR